MAIFQNSFFFRSIDAQFRVDENGATAASTHNPVPNSTLITFEEKGKNAPPPSEHRKGNRRQT